MENTIIFLILATILLRFSQAFECRNAYSEEHCEHLHRRYQVLKKIHNEATVRQRLNPKAFEELDEELNTVLEKIGHEPPLENVEDIESYKDMYNPNAGVVSASSHIDVEDNKDSSGSYTEGEENTSQYNSGEGHSGYGQQNTVSQGSDIDISTLKCDPSVPKTRCDELLKKYKVMKELYNDDDLMDLLDPNAYGDLHREMEEAGIDFGGQTKKKKKSDEYSNMKCDPEIPKGTCDKLVQKYKVMKELYNDDNLMSMLKPDAYSKLHSEMVRAGIDVPDKRNDKQQEEKNKMQCHPSVPKERCDDVMRRYKVMKEMYSDEVLMKMLDPNAYSDLHREMEELGIQVPAKKAKGSYAKQEENDSPCHPDVPKKKCDELLRQYKVMKTMYDDELLMKMLDPNAYSNLHREMEAAGIQMEKKENKKSSYGGSGGGGGSSSKCKPGVSKEKCDELLRQYKVMKEMYSDEALMKMLDPNAYGNLHREMEAAGIQMENKKSPRKKYESSVSIRRCLADGLYYLDDHRFVICSNGFGFVQSCPLGSRNSDRGAYGGNGNYGFNIHMFCNISRLAKNNVFSGFSSY